MVCFRISSGGSYRRGINLTSQEDAQRCFRLERKATEIGKAEATFEVPPGFTVAKKAYLQFLVDGAAKCFISSALPR